jgi:hypothetical protein
MSQYLHLRAFTGRPASAADFIAAHAINPMLQPVLSRIAALSLPQSYRLGDAYEYGRAFAEAAVEVTGPELGRLIQEDLSLLQDSGRDRLGEVALRLRGRYGAFAHPAAREIVAWLDADRKIVAD